MGQLGEEIAARFLKHHGLRVEANNVEVGTGELDLLAVDAGERVVVEVRTTTGGVDPIDAIGPGKRKRVEMLARHVRAQRVDFVGIRLGSAGAEVHWVPGGG